MDIAIDNISKNTLINYRFREIIKDWAKIVEKNITLQGDYWESTKTKLSTRLTELKNDINTIADTKDKKNFLKDGFLSRIIPLKAEQTISYSTLKKYFEKITISIIS